jgi:CDP-diglyceride synthetase
MTILKHLNRFCEHEWMKKLLLCLCVWMNDIFGLYCEKLCVRGEYHGYGMVLV